MIAEVSILPAIRRLYDAATDAEKWPRFLKELADCFNSDGAHLIRVQPNPQVMSFSVLYGYDETLHKLYGGDGVDLATALTRYEQHLNELIPTDPRIRLAERYPSRPISCRLEISEAELHGSKIYQDHLKHVDVEYTLGFSIPEEDGSLILLGVFRGKSLTAFNQKETELYGELIPHLKQAVALSEHLARVDFTNRTALEALDSVSMGVLIVDQHACVMHTNATATRIIGFCDGIAVQNGVLKLHSKEEDASLRRAIWDAVTNVHTECIPANQSMAVSRPSGNDSFPLLIATLWGNHLRYGLGRLDKPLAVVFVTIPEEPQEAPAELLRRLFGFTPAEARVCERIVGGATVEETAGALGIGFETVRTHLKSVFAKTGVGRQAELVARIMATPVWMQHKRRNKNARQAN